MEIINETAWKIDKNLLFKLDIDTVKLLHTKNSIPVKWIIYLRIQTKGEYPIPQSYFPRLPMKLLPMPFAKEYMDALYGQETVFCHHLQELFVARNLCPTDHCYRQVALHCQTHSVVRNIIIKLLHCNCTYP